ncbi:hypothetical protein HDU88_004523 [Geranomyces variabilis]|nr:dolichol phosphate-mannose biosynthesis regulatory [Geranomyces variabilis]KAJ3173064.1 hypothetical protein HDU88_004523 [Geranomyces variabilis]
MGSISDRALGAALIGIAMTVFVYYSLWVLVLPFVDPSHPFQAYFPPPEWAIRIPVFLLVTAVSVVISFISLVMIKSGRKKKST